MNDTAHIADRIEPASGADTAEARDVVERALASPGGRATRKSMAARLPRPAQPGVNR